MDYKVELLEKSEEFKGYFEVNKYRFSYRQFNGKMGAVVEREIFERGHAVAVLPYDPIKDVIILIEQFRPGVFVGIQNPHWQNKQTTSWMYEIIAGIIDEGETIDDVAIRETKEEANLEIANLKYIQPFFVSPGAVSEFIHLYVAQVNSEKAGGVFGLDVEAEDIKTHILPCDEVWKMLDEGKITNATALIALQWLRYHREQVREEWLKR
ncbi:MAG: NUDIX domain-containing protein [Alphaproteobacteria bacterium]